MPVYDAFPMFQAGEFRYLDEGPVTSLPPIVLLHGMLGDLSNWTSTVRVLVDRGYRVLVPVLPLYDLTLEQTNVKGLTQYIHSFLVCLGVNEVALVGNSLGGHIALFFAIDYPRYVKSLILSGASGIYEVEWGRSTFRRRDKAFIRQKAELTFYDPRHVTDTLIEELYDVVMDRSRVIRLIRMARATKEETVSGQLHDITAPTLLIWGTEDCITPPHVAHQFLKNLPNAELHFIAQCGHAPMIEHPVAFNVLMLTFLDAKMGKAPLSYPSLGLAFEQ